MKFVQKRFKSTLGLLLAALLLFSCLPLAALAQETEKAEEQAQESAVVKFNDIALIVKNNNLQLKNNEMTLLNTTSNDKLGDAQANLAASAKLMGAAGSVLSSLTGSLIPDEKASELASGYFLMDSTSLLTQAASMAPTQQQIDLIKLQLEQVSLQIQQGSEALYYNMTKLGDGLGKARRSRPLLEQAALLAETAESVGMGTRAAALQAQLGLSDMDATISGLELNWTTMTYELNKLMGRDYNAPLELAPLPTPDLEYYDAIDLEADLAAAVKSSYTLRYLQREREGIGSDDYDATAREKKMKDNEIEMETQVLKAALTLLHQTIADDRVKLANEQVRLELSQYDAATAETGFAAGQISEMELKQAREALATQQDAVKDAEQTLFWNIRRYQWAMIGLPVGS